MDIYHHQQPFVT